MKRSVKILIVCLSFVFVVGVALIIAACLQSGSGTANAAASFTLTENQTAMLATGIVGITVSAVSALLILFSGNAGIYSVLKYFLVGFLALILSGGATAALDVYYNFSDAFLYEQYRNKNGFGGVATSDDDIYYDFAFSTEKVLQTDNLGTDDDYVVKLAKNEWEGYQITVVSKKDVDVILQVTDYEKDEAVIPVTVYKEWYTSVKDTAVGSEFSNGYPDALIPYEGTESVALDAYYSQTFYIELHSDIAAPAGNYAASLKLICNNIVILEKTMTAKVYNFEVPVTPSMDTAIGVWGVNEIAAACNMATATSAEKTELYKKYYETVLSRRLSPYYIPYDVSDERADAYMSDPRLTTFQMDYGDRVSESAKVNANSTWKEKGYFYPIDEPDSASEIVAYNSLVASLQSDCADGEFNMVTPFYGIEVEDKENEGVYINNFDVQSGKSNISCPESICFESDEFYERTMERVSDGDRSWWYVCCGPSGLKGYCNMFIYQQGSAHRILFWQQRKYDVTGFLYWNITYYSKANPWESSKTWESYDCAGDGCWLYPNGNAEPIISLRLTNVTDGTEDYEYFTLAEKLYGEEWIEAKIAEVTQGLTDYTDDPAVLQSVRDSIAEAIEAKI